VGFHHFLLMMIFWRLRNLNYCCKKRRIHGLWVLGCLYPITIYVFRIVESCFSRCSQGFKTTWPSQCFQIQTNFNMASKSLWTFSYPTTWYSKSYPKQNYKVSWRVLRANPLLWINNDSNINFFLSTINFGTLWKLIGFFIRLLLVLFFLFFIWRWCCYILQGKCNRKKNNILCCLSSCVTLLICVTFIEHLSYYCCCCDYFGNKPKNKYVRKMSTTNMSYLWVCN
jgi:hypothetical protein